MSPSGKAFRAPPVGATLGAYRLESELGRGAAGVVYRARHSVTGAAAAVKVVATGAGGDAAERFAREVEALARLRHPNVVAIHAAGAEEACGWLAMDLVEGTPLDRILARHDLPPRQLVVLVLQVARGVAHAHERGIIHRDLKPQNVIVTAEGVARVTDFGLAKHLGRETRLTETGAFLGTPYYMAPEQAVGNAVSVDARTDVWAVGVMLYEAITGTLPFQGDGVLVVCRAICSLDPEPPRARAPGLAPELEAITLRALEKEPARRYATMEALALDLESHLRGERISASARPRALVGLGRVARPLTAGALVLVGLAVVLALSLGARARESALDADALAAVRNQSARIEAECRSSADRLAALAGSSLEVAVVASRDLARLARAGEELARTSPRAVAQVEARALAARLATAPVRARLALLGARALARLGETGAARAQLDVASREGVRDPALETARGELALGEADAPGALAAFEKAVALDPRAGEALAGAIRARCRGATAADLPALERELELVESEHLASPGAVALARATVLAAVGSGDAALPLLKEPTGAFASAALLLRARIQRARGDEPAARRSAVAAALLDPAAGRAAAREDHELGAFADEARLLDTLVKHEPDDVRSIVALAELRGSLGELDTAVADLRRSLAQLERSEAGKARAGPVIAALGPLERAARTVAGDRGAVPPGSPSPGPAPPAGSERALDLEAVRLARAGDVPGAVRARARAEAARSEAARRAFREGRADALAITEGDLLSEGAEPTPGVRRLAARAVAELAYAAELSPGSGAPRGLLARLTLALGDKAAARAHAKAALEADPLDHRGAIVLLATSDPQFAIEEIHATEAALAAAPWPAALELASIRGRRATTSRLKSVGVAIARGLLEQHSHDRAALVVANDILKAIGDPVHTEAQQLRAESQALLAACEAEVARARKKVAESDLCSNRDDRAEALRLALAALAITDEDSSVLETAERCERQLHRGKAGQAPLRLDTAAVEPLARSALRRRLAPVDAIRHASALAELLPPEAVAWARARIEAARDPHERVVTRAALALLLGGAAISQLDARGRLLGEMPTATPAEGLAALEPLLDETPELVVGYGLRALQLARAGRRESSTRDLDRVLFRRSAGMSEHQLAAMALVLEGDVPGAAREAILGIGLARPGDDASRAFLAEAPFSAIAEEDAWSVVRARLRK